LQQYRGSFAVVQKNMLPAVKIARMRCDFTRGLTQAGGDLHRFEPIIFIQQFQF